MTDRKYLPTLADLVDRLTIVQQKAVFIPERRDEYRLEIDDILHDIDVILTKLPKPLGAAEIRAICVIQLANRFIWENESIARNGGDGHDSRLKLTHSINGVRNSAKNVLSHNTGGRQDYKVDCLASNLPAEFGNWDIFS
jgi:hypothetical protein